MLCYGGQDEERLSLKKCRFCGIMILRYGGIAKGTYEYLC